MPQERIVIVGGGAAAVCALDALAQSSCPSAHLTVFEPSTLLWRGVPYERDSDVLRLNIAQEGMSVRHGDATHFERWLDRQGLAITPDPISGARFGARSHYGTYLEESAGSAMDRLRTQGWRVDIVREQVVHAARLRPGLLLTTKSGRHTRAGHVVLCVGNGPAPDIYDLSGTPGYLPSPYPVSQQLSDIDPGAEIAILGTGLAAVDSVLALAAQGHQGPIHMLSRTGALPAVRQQPIDYTLHHLTFERLATIASRKQVTLQTVSDALAAELGEVEENIDDIAAEIDAITEEPPAQRLERQLNDVASPRLGVRIVQSMLPQDGPRIWSLLPEKERSYLARQYSRTIVSLCCPMPPATSARLFTLMEAGQLHIHGSIRNVTTTDDGFHITSAHTTCNADIVINAISASPGTFPTRAKPLLDSLLRAQLASHHPGGGLHVDPDSSQLTVSGIPQPGLYALGNLTQGAHLFTYGIHPLINRTHEITQSVVRSINSAECSVTN